MLKSLLDLVSVTVTEEKRTATRVAPTESYVLIDRKKFNLKNWSTVGFLASPFGGIDMAVGQKCMMGFFVKDPYQTIEFEATIVITRVGGGELAGKFFLLSPYNRKMIDSYFKSYKG